jgi:transcriptional regulator with PAS, ATPase and Fis domain
MDRMPASVGPGESCRQSESWRGLGAIVDALVAAIRHEQFDQLRARFEGASAHALGWREVRLTVAAGGPRSGDSLVCERATWDVAVPGTSAVVKCDPGETDHGTGAGGAHLLNPLASLAALTLEVERLQPAVPRPARRLPAWRLVGSSAAIEHVRQRLLQVARTNFPVLVEGESGVGKEVVARLIHEHSRRSRGLFVAVNCAAIVDTLVEAELFGIEDRTATGVRGRRGRFEVADGGTLFLDEIGDLSLAAQAKLLRVLQDFTVERVGGHAAVPVNVRVLAATNRSLADLVAQARFRADLFYRLNGVEIVIPPLRDRLGDVPELVEHVLSRHREYGIVGVTHEAMAALGHYAWPGNVRELERVVERAITLAAGGLIGVEHLPGRIAGPFSEVFDAAMRQDASLRQFATHYVRLVMRRCGNNKRAACRVLGISYHTLDAYLKRAAAPTPMPGDEVDPGRCRGLHLPGGKGGEASGER